MTNEIPSQEANGPEQSGIILKPNSQFCKLKEQIIHDPASGLTLQLEIDEQGCTHLRLFGTALPFRNREIVFNQHGIPAATATLTRGLCKPTWFVRRSDVAA